MNIIAGAARNLELESVPAMEVRPTAGRARKALFDSLGPLDGVGFTDLFSGSGAIALEAASRGAAQVILVERDAGHCAVIRRNIERVRRTGAAGAIELINADVLVTGAWLGRAAASGIIFADPPYAASSELFTKLLGSAAVRETLAGKQLIWELPDTPGAIGAFLDTPFLAGGGEIRNCGGTCFLRGSIRQ